MAKAKEDAYGITESATDQGVITIGETGWSQALDRVEDSSEIFVSNATDGFGFAPPATCTTETSVFIRRG